MAVSRAQIVGRGLTHRCPNCGSRTLFHGWRRWVAVRERCGVCGLVFEREEGFFLGAMVISYTFTGLALIPALILVASNTVAVVWVVLGLIVWAIVFPLLFYRTSKSLWLMAYYFALPGELPANRGSRAEL